MKHSTISTQKNSNTTPAGALTSRQSPDAASASADSTASASATPSAPAATATPTAPTARSAAAAPSAAKSTPAGEPAGPAENRKQSPNRLKAFIKNPTVKYTLLFLGGMILLYLFSMFGGMLSSPGFTYAEF